MGYDHCFTISRYTVHSQWRTSLIAESKLKFDSWMMSRK